MQPPSKLLSNYPRQVRPRAVEESLYRILILHTYVMLNWLVAAQIGLVLAVACVLAVSSAPIFILPIGVLAIAALLLPSAIMKVLRKVNGWTRYEMFRRAFSITFLTPVLIGVYLAWRLRQEIESELREFGCEPGLLGLGIHVARAEEHLFNMRLKKAIPESDFDE